MVLDPETLFKLSVLGCVFFILLMYFPPFQGQKMDRTANVMRERVDDMQQRATGQVWTLGSYSEERASF